MDGLTKDASLTVGSSEKKKMAFRKRKKKLNYLNSSPLNSKPKYKELIEKESGKTRRIVLDYLSYFYFFRKLAKSVIFLRHKEESWFIATFTPLTCLINKWIIPQPA